MYKMLHQKYHETPHIVKESYEGYESIIQNPKIVYIGDKINLELKIKMRYASKTGILINELNIDYNYEYPNEGESPLHVSKYVYNYFRLQKLSETFQFHHPFWKHVSFFAFVKIAQKEPRFDFLLLSVANLFAIRCFCTTVSNDHKQHFKYLAKNHKKVFPK